MPGEYNGGGASAKALFMLVLFVIKTATPRIAARQGRVGEKGDVLSETPLSFWSAPKYRLVRVLIYFAALVVATEIGVFLYFSQPDLIDRNQGNTTFAMPYLFRQMARHRGPKIAFIGSSVMQGYGNCLPDTHFPALIEKTLREKYGMKNMAAYNLASAGNRFGDHFGNLVEAERYHPTLVVMGILLKMFSVSGTLVSPINHDETIYYFRDEPDYLERYKKRFRVDPERYRQIWLDFQIRRLSQTYRYRGLLNYFLTGDYERPSASLSDWLKIKLDWQEAILTESALTTQTERNEDYLWKLIPEHVIKLNYRLCEAFDFSDENLNWKTFEELCGYAEKHGINLLFYLNPICRPFNDQWGFFQWNEVVPLLKQRILDVTQKHHLHVIDAVEKIDYRYFSDLDHMNMNGHRQMADYLLPHVVRQLNRGR